jgi:hypothetical protein
MIPPINHFVTALLRWAVVRNQNEEKFFILHFLDFS